MKNKLKDLKMRAKDVLSGKRGMTMVEIIVLISVILVIATALFLMRGVITDFIGGATDQLDTLNEGGTIGEGSNGLVAKPAQKPAK